MDQLIEAFSRALARRTSRRGALGSLGTLLLGGALAPLLPVHRVSAAQHAATDGNPLGCDYWRYCGLDGFLCGCCGGSQHACPPGTSQSPVTWIGTCRNPADGKNYVISYNDCCGKHICGLCFCHRNHGDKPIYYPSRSNDINWCYGTTSVVYNCSTAIVVQVATE